MQHAPKATNVLTHLHDVPSELQDTVRQALLNITYIDNGGVGADSLELHSELQDKIGKILKKGDIHIKACESYGEVGCSKYLGRTWNRKDDLYLLKFRMNRHQKMHGIPSGDDKGSEFLLNKSLPITKKNVLSVACQFYYSNSLATPLMVTIRILFSKVCRDRGCSMQTHLSADRANRFRSAVTKILGTTALSFPRQIVLKILVGTNDRLVGINDRLGMNDRVGMNDSVDKNDRVGTNDRKGTKDRMSMNNRLVGTNDRLGTNDRPGY